MQTAAYLKSLPVLPAAQQDIVIDTYMHIVAESNSTEGGYALRKDVEEQFQVLVDGFKGSGINFTLKDISWTVKKDLSNLRGGTQPQAKALRKGGYNTLNLYYVKFIDGAGGYCNYPVRNPSKSQMLDDGCWQRISTMAYNKTPRKMVKTTTHEVGHWLHLFHPHEGGCNNPGDHVDDTPAEKLEEFKIYECNNKDKDTCPKMPRKDPIHNYMAYVFDSCKDHFTPGQKERMRVAWDKLRKGRTVV
ncbi:hypothetical protein VHEMI02770 [[Torrubiella] hemipterigena]|uniref:Peptidase M43 pregnancy-associated plasma-A domain-containing protein n=1 Tax=[Torrubiella] hemipterigena TaxID=1531966 RepID=A0A0A1SWR5_9HYPO|nr:hypothetical protein VHEMI02770 [[Torrubiella] hemipterigena]